jgi:hypothetical protein
VVEAYGLTGTAEALSAPVAIADLPAPAPTTPTLTVNLAAVPSGDAVAPTTRVLKLSCTKRGVCVLEVRVVDPAPSAGVRAPEATVTTAYRTTCVKHGRRRACTKTVVHRLKAVASGINTYKITTPRLRKGTQTFRLVASDLKGNRQVRATTVRKTTR